MNLIALAELEPDFIRLLETYKKVKAIVHAAIPPEPQADIAGILGIVADIGAGIKPLIPDIVHGITTAEKAASILTAPAPEATWKGF